MQLRERLNAGYFTGSLLLAAILGGAAGSWLVFGLALVVLVSLNMYNREIRLSPSHRHGRDRR